MPYTTELALVNSLSLSVPSERRTTARTEDHETAKHVYTSLQAYTMISIASQSTEGSWAQLRGESSMSLEMARVFGANSFIDVFVRLAARCILKLQVYEIALTKLWQTSCRDRL